MKNILSFTILTFLFSLSNTHAQTSLFPKLGYGQADLNDWKNREIDHNLHSYATLNKFKHDLFFAGVGIEQKFTKNFKLVLSSSYSSKLSYTITSHGSWGNIKRQTKHQFLASDLSMYYRIFSNFSLGGGVTHLNLRNFKYPDEEYEEVRGWYESQNHHYWGYHFGINYEWKSLGFLLQYSQTKISKKSLTNEIIYPVNKIPLLTFSVLYKFKIANKINFQNIRFGKKKKSGCPTF